MPMRWCGHERGYFPDGEFAEVNGKVIHTPSKNGKPHPAVGHSPVTVRPNKAAPEEKR